MFILEKLIPAPGCNTIKSCKQQFIKVSEIMYLVLFNYVKYNMIVI